MLSSDVSLDRPDTGAYYFFEGAEGHTYWEHFDGDKYQLMIKADSPFLAKNVGNRSNNDYTTKDLFIKSTKSPNGYYYAGRADDILVM